MLTRMATLREKQARRLPIPAESSLRCTCRLQLLPRVEFRNVGARGNMTSPPLAKLVNLSHGDVSPSGTERQHGW